jgi:hypothetical protein
VSADRSCEQHQCYGMQKFDGDRSPWVRRDCCCSAGAELQTGVSPPPSVIVLESVCLLSD